MANSSVQNISQLITQAKQGDREAENELFNRAQKQIALMVRRRLNRFPGLRERGVETIDVVGVAVSQFAMNLRRKGWDQIVDERHFFKRVACYIHWALLNIVRKKNTKRTVTMPNEELVPPRTSDTFSLQTMNEFHQAVEKLPEDVRKVFKRRFYDGLAQKAVADELGVSEDTVKRRYREAKDTLQKLLRT